MKRSFLKVAALLSVGVFVAAQAREIRTPIPFMHGMLHYPVEYGWEQEPQNDDCWNFDVQAFGGAYYRSADAAYGPCDGRNTVPWSNLIFGKSEFRLEEAFFGADIPGGLENPFVAIALLNAKYDYNERGAVFGLTLSSNYEYCDTNYRFGLRARLPFRDVEVATVCGLTELGGSIGINDVYQQRQETTLDDEVQTNTVFAVRLDFLSALKRIAPNNTQTKDFVIYRDTVPTPDQITMADQLVGQPIGDPNHPVIAVIQRTDGSVPVDQTWGAQASAITATVAANGAGLANNTRARFEAATDYTALGANTAQQSQLWVVPTLNNDSAGLDENKISGGTALIQGQLNAVINSIDDSVLDFLDDQGLDFCDGRNQGLGNLDLELYLGRNWGCDEQFWTDLMFGVTFPTADDDCDLADCKKVLRQPVGNGDHFEIHGGIAGGWDASSWVKLMGDVQFYGVLSDTEKVAAPFLGATVKNIGPCVNADIKWWYVLGHLDLTFFASDCCGFDFGYELYHKDCDNISLCQKTATEFIDNGARALDASVLSKNTERTSHKLRVGFFSVIGDCEIFGGWSHVVAGKNIGRETDWYMSMSINF